VAGERLLLPAAGAVMQYRPDYRLALWHGINLPLVLSLATFAIGGALYAYRAKLVSLLDRLNAALPTTGDRAYDAAMAGLVRLAGWQTRLLQNGVQRDYMRVVFATLAIAVGGTLVLKHGLMAPEVWTSPTYYEWGAVLLIVLGTGATVLAESRLLAICALGTVGIGVALIFLMFSAPDVALTQLLVETLVVVIAALVLLKLPYLKFTGRRITFGRTLDAIIALAVGGTVTATLLAVTAVPIDLSLTEFFEVQAVPGGFGRNIVNVILVDFRAFDTLGEVAVVAVAGLAAYALIKLRSGGNGSSKLSKPSLPEEKQ
jgi:multicomponent Na+:H+ antiporter subunit A